MSDVVFRGEVIGETQPREARGLIPPLVAGGLCCTLVFSTVGFWQGVAAGREQSRTQAANISRAIKAHTIIGVGKLAIPAGLPLMETPAVRSKSRSGHALSIAGELTNPLFYKPQLDATALPDCLSSVDSGWIGGEFDPVNFPKKLLWINASQLGEHRNHGESCTSRADGTLRGAVTVSVDAGANGMSVPRPLLLEGAPLVVGRFAQIESKNTS